MKKLLLSLLFVIAFHPFFTSGAEAQYLSGSDKNISINTGLNLHIPLNTAETSFKLQEGLHNTLTETTGIEIDHSYIWIELDGQTILGIDPAKAMY